MKYIVDHDLHIHSYLSVCARDPEMTPAAILNYGVENGYKYVCVTDHFWDSTVKCTSDDWHNGWAQSDYKDNSTILPLPQSDSCKFLFGCEADMNMFDDIGITRETCTKFDFVVLATTHLHMKCFTADPNLATVKDYRDAYVRRIFKVLDADLPHGKIGIAHLESPLACKPFVEEFYSTMPDSVYREIFEGIKSRGCGVELNFDNFTIDNYHGDADKIERYVYRPYRIAKDVGCKFYFGSDAHHPRFAGLKANFEKQVDIFGLTEDDKFHVPNVI